MLLKMAIGQDAQVQNGLVAIAIAVRAATPFVIAYPLNLVQQRLVSSIIARENRLARLPASLPLTQPEVDRCCQPVQKWGKVEERLPSPGVVDGVRRMSQSKPRQASFPNVGSDDDR